ncbi:MAG TPA: DUF5996 family protein [Chthoniobacterales bacterium]|jgi:hypothetical protein|nr:DUF5996 family protein [Chthoniobacterales bacterium]
MADETWPALPYAEWKGTAKTLHMWTQVVGKIRLALTPWINHSWHVTLYLTARGMTTSPIYSGNQVLQVDFDFVDHVLRIVGGTAAVPSQRTIPLAPKSVAAFYHEVMTALSELGITVAINTTPNEVDPAIPFEENETDAAYDPEYANRFWRVLLQSDRVFKQFRSEFCGKCSPVHFFWGSFDLAVTRFSGRPAPKHPGGIPHLPDAVTREAYSQEVSSLGFWPGNEMMPEPIFYSYAYPAPAGFAGAKVRPEGAFYHEQLKEFALRYDDVRTAASPDLALLDFAHSTYDAASTLAAWDRAALSEVKPDLHSRPQRR